MDPVRKVKKALKEYWRVLRITSKPDWEEFQMSSKVTGIGVVLVGLIGFLIYMTAQLIVNRVA